MKTTTLETKRMQARTTASGRIAGLREIDPALADELDAADDARKAAEPALEDVTARLRRLNPPPVFREEQPGKRRQDFDDLDDVDRRVAIADLDADRVTVSRRVEDARAAHAIVKRRAVNAMLTVAVADWRSQADAKITAASSLEQAFGRLIATAAAFGEATAAERAAARSTVALAEQGVVGIDATRALGHLARTGRLPAEVDADGAVQTAGRPDDGLFGDDEFDLIALVQLVELTYREPEQARRQLQDTAVGRVAFP
jgi:hypothetical protein